MTKAIFLLPFTLLALNLSGCSLLKKAVQAPEISIQRVDVDNLNLKTADLLFHLKVVNPNAIDLKIDTLDYRLTLNDKEFAEGKVTKIKNLPAEKTTEMVIPIPVELGKVFDSLLAAFQKPDTEYNISGAAKLGPISVPFNEKGKVKWIEN